MTAVSRMRILVGGIVAATVLASAAWAHHGWDWAEEAQFELTGTILEMYVGPPHPTLQVQTADDGVWTIELGNPRQTERSGFGEDSAAPGDTIVALGNRSLDADEPRMKAVRITVRDRTYDIYPDRIQAD